MMEMEDAYPYRHENIYICTNEAENGPCIGV